MKEKIKEERVKVFDKHFNALKQLPNDYQISLNHMKKINNISKI